MNQCLKFYPYAIKLRLIRTRLLNLWGTYKTIFTNHKLNESISLNETIVYDIYVRLVPLDWIINGIIWKHNKYIIRRYQFIGVQGSKCVKWNEIIYFLSLNCRIRILFSIIKVPLFMISLILNNIGEIVKKANITIQLILIRGIIENRYIFAFVISINTKMFRSSLFRVSCLYYMHIPDTAHRWQQQN